MGDTVDVRIYGQTYHITGDKSEEEIQKIADYVDDQMHLISKVVQRNGTSAIAVLTSINIAEEYFNQMDEMNRRNMLRILGKDPEHKVHLLLDFSDDPRPISDPWYTGRFESTYDDILEGCGAFLEYLKERGEI